MWTRTWGGGEGAVESLLDETKDLERGGARSTRGDVEKKAFCFIFTVPKVIIYLTHQNNGMGRGGSLLFNFIPKLRRMRHLVNFFVSIMKSKWGD